MFGECEANCASQVFGSAPNLKLPYFQFFTYYQKPPVGAA